MMVFNANTLKIVLVAGAVLVTASPSIARMSCTGGFYRTKTKTEKVFVPAKMDCVKDTSNFADFSNGCNYTPAHYDEIQTTYKEWVPERCREVGNFGNRE